MKRGRLAIGMAAAAALAAAPWTMEDAMAKAPVKWTQFVPTGDAARDAIPGEYKWSLANLYPTPEAWELAYGEADVKVGELASCKGTAGKDAASVRRCLDLAFDVRRLVERLMNYADASYTINRTDGALKARADRGIALATRASGAMAFLEPELLAVDATTLQAWASQPELKVYAHYLDDLVRRKPHVLNPDAERVLALSGDLRAAPQSIQNALEEDVTFPKVKDEKGRKAALTRASFPRFRASLKRSVRMEAVKTFFATLKASGRSFTASLDAAVKGNILVAKARNYASALEASLDQGAVPVSVYDVLSKTTTDNLPRTLHRYVALRQKLMKLDAVHYYDLYVPMFPKAKQKVSYPEGVDLALEALKPLGKDYMDVLAKGLDPANGWVDVYPSKGKRSGAYCNSSWRDHPIVFLNHMDELEDVFTLVHELGHAMNFHLADWAQEYVNRATPIFLAEIASTFNEQLLLDHLLKKAKGKDQRLYLLNRRVESIRTTVFRQVLFAEFERAIHEEIEKGQALTPDRMGEIYRGLLRKFYGPEYVIDPDDAAEWEYIPHFYYNFYVYQYATGLMSAIALSTRVLAGEPGAVDGYIEFLKAGGSDYPIPILQRAGVDLTKPDAMQATFDVFARTLDEIEKLVE